jgi:ABC-type nitrate/sulfonate/bicarbonate transport system ATPase subunit
MKIQNVSLDLGGNHILANVNAEIPDIKGKGQIVSIVGRSGIGKTQLFRILSGFQKPTTGTITITKDDIPVKIGQVGVIAQKCPLFEDRTVESNLLIAASKVITNKKEALEKVTEMLHIFEMADRKKLYPIQLSGGQQQRISIAQQLLCSEHFILMDEPFAALDAITIDDVRELITKTAALHELNTFIVVTHDIRSALRIGDILWVMNRDTPDQGAYIKYVHNLIDLGFTYDSSDSKFTEYSHLIKEQLR